MDLSLSDIAISGAIQILMFWAVGAWAWRLMPNVQSVCDKVELVKKVLSFIGEAPEWVNYNQNLEDDVESLRREMETLLCAERDVSQELEMLEFQNNVRRKREVEYWRSNVERVNQEVMEVEREMEQTGKVFRFLFRAWLGSRVEKTKKQISRLLEQKTAFQQHLVINAHRVGQEKLPTDRLVGQVANQRKEDIWRHLTSHEVNILGIVGDPGMGKSTTMMHIYNQVLDNPSLFGYAFYVNINEENSFYQLQTAIGREMKLSGLEDADDEIRRAARISRALKSAKKFVLILDGLMSPFELHNVGIPLENNGGIGQLVVVSQSMRVCHRMLCRPIIRFDALPFEDASKLFMETLNLSGDLSPQITPIADEIIRRCNGVPGRIKEAAESLRNEDDVSNWWAMLNEL